MSWYTKFRAITTRCRSRWHPRLERRREEAKLVSEPKAPTQGTGKGKRTSAGGGCPRRQRCKVEARKPPKGVRERSTFKCALRDQALKERGLSGSPLGDAEAIPSGPGMQSFSDGFAGIGCQGEGKAGSLARRAPEGTGGSSSCGGVWKASTGREGGTSLGFTPVPAALACGGTGTFSWAEPLLRRPRGPPLPSVLARRHLSASGSAGRSRRRRPE